MHIESTTVRPPAHPSVRLSVRPSVLQSVCPLAYHFLRYPFTLTNSPRGGSRVRAVNRQQGSHAEARLEISQPGNPDPPSWKLLLNKPGNKVNLAATFAPGVVGQGGGRWNWDPDLRPRGGGVGDTGNWDPPHPPAVWSARAVRLTNRMLSWSSATLTSGGGGCGTGSDKYKGNCETRFLMICF